MSYSISSVGGSSTPQVWSGASGYASPAAKMNKVYDQIDTSKSGAITSPQLQQSFAGLNPPADFQSLGAEAIFNQLDPNGSGSVSKSDFVAGMVQLMKSMSSAKLQSNGATTSPTVSTSDTLKQSLNAFQQLTGSQSINSISGNSLDAWF